MSHTKEVFKTMERKLYNYIMMPAMLLSWLFGIVINTQSWFFSVFRIMDANKNSCSYNFNLLSFLL